jgi:hypothetical protein
MRNLPNRSKKEKMMKKRKMLLLVSLMVIGGVLFSACASARSATADKQSLVMPEAEMGSDMAMEAPAAMEDESLESSRNYDAGVGGSNEAADRMVIYNADMEIAVEDPIASMDAIIAMAEDAGGFVVYSNLYQSTGSNGKTIPQASLTVRVPAGQLESIMDAIKALTPDPDVDVLSENVSGQDVTAEYTDLQSRLRNLEAAEAALVELMNDAQDPQDVLDVFDELTYYRGEIEMVKGRMKYLEESASMSAITVQVIAKESLQPIEIAGWEPKGTAKKAVEALIDTGQFIADAAIWFGIYCLPFLVPLGIAAYFLIKVLRKRKARRQSKKMEALQQLDGSAPEEK